MGTPLRALLVEDSEDDALLIVRELRRAGYDIESERVDTAADMASALERRTWDVILCDYSMPRFSGPAALALVQEKGLDLPFLIVSGVIGEEAAVEAMKAGAQDYIMKGNLARLAPAVERELRDAAARREGKVTGKALWESQERYRELADLLPEVVFEIDAPGTLTFINRRGLELFGLTREDLAGRTALSQLIASKDRERALRDADRVLRGEAVGVNQYDAVRKDGSVFPVIVHTSRIVREGRPIALRGVMVDITDLQRAERERDRLAAAVEHAAEMIVISEPSGIIRYANPAFETTTGYTREEAIGRPMDYLYAEATGEETLKAMRMALSLGEPWAGHLVGKKSDGSLFEEECTVSPIRNGSGNVIHYVTVRRNVTEHLRLEKMFRQAQKLEALGALAGGIAHDFKNILMPIIGYTQLTYDDLPPLSEGRENLERVLSAASRARDLVDQILAFSRQGEQQRSPVRLGFLVREVLSLMRASLPATVEIRETIGVAADTVLADPIQIHQLLVNLCTNAGQALEGKPGLLEVGLEDVEVDTGFASRNPDMKPGAYLRLTLRDTGCGMTHDVLERIFEPFFTTRGDKGGTGLGLAVVHGIVRSHGGAIRVYSEPGQGTAFHVYFPKAHPGSEEEARAEEPPPTGTERILFVDDEEAIVDVAQRILEGLGYRITTAASGTEALEAFRGSPEGFDLVITDQTMPKMTGLSLIREIRRLRPGIPVILISGLTRATWSDEAKSAGIDSLVTKPLTPQELGRAARHALDRVKEPGA